MDEGVEGVKVDFVDVLTGDTPQDKARVFSHEFEVVEAHEVCDGFDIHMSGQNVHLGFGDGLYYLLAICRQQVSGCCT